MVRERDGGGVVVIFKTGRCGARGQLQAVRASSGQWERVQDAGASPAAFPWLLMRDPGKIYTHTTG